MATIINRTEEVPHDRLTRMCATMLAALEADPEYQEGDRAIVLLDDEAKGGITLHGWENDAEAMAALFVHVRAIFQSNGSDLAVVPTEAVLGTVVFMDHEDVGRERFEEREPNLPSFNWAIDTPVPQIIGEAIGAASMCWEHPHAGGVYDSERASYIMDEVIAALQRKLWVGPEA